MFLSESAANPQAGLLTVEAGLTLITVALAFCWPRMGSGAFAAVERVFAVLARRRLLAVATVAGAAAGVRLLLLPLVPIPQPAVEPDFSFLLAADTFAAGRLTNPTHPMWTHFETIHVSHVPTYMSMYFPAQGMVMAAGKVLAGHEWYGVLASTALMCAAICWMLQGWAPPGWALLGGMLAVLRLGLFSYWINTYDGGAVAAIGGALVLGAVPRLWRGWKVADFLLMATGMALLANSRPYEGLLVCVPSLGAIVWGLRSKPHPGFAVLVKRIAPAACVLVATLAFIGYYNYRVFGSAFTPAYKVNREMYASAPHLLFQHARPAPVYRHATIREFYQVWELDWFKKSRSLSGLIEVTVRKVLSSEVFFLAFALAVPLVMLPRVLRDRRIRFLTISAAIFLAGIAVETWMSPHYAAPFVAGFYALLIQCMRHMRAGPPSCLFLARAIPAACVLLAVVRVCAHPLHVQLADERFVSETWFGTHPLGLARAAIVHELENAPGGQLAIVRYSADHDPQAEWVYNGPDIDQSKIVWAREMDPASDAELTRYFRDRTAWLVQPDLNPPQVSLYPKDRLVVEGGAKP